jgi:hypothetical protein
MTFRDVQYVTDASGAERAVQIPISAWKKHLREFDQLKKKLELLTDLKKSMREAKRMEKGTLAKQPLAALLREL